jgi:photosystem II stability/assembly factor-like uncharacterized protein
VAIDPHDPNTIYQSTLGAGVRKSTDGGASWSDMNTGLTNLDLPSAVAIDPADPQTLYVGTNGQGVFKTTDGGAHWSQMGLRGGVYGPVVIDPDHPDTVYAGRHVGAGANLSKTTDGGVTWTAADQGIPGTVFSLALDPSHPDTLFAGSFDGSGIFKTTDGGGHWFNVRPGGFIWSLALDPSTPTTIYAGTNGDGVLRSDDGGMTWRGSMDSGLTDRFVEALAVDPAGPDTVYAGTFGGGAFRSTDGGATWSGTALDTGFVNGLAVDPGGSGKVYAATGFRGLLESTDQGESWSALDREFQDSCACQFGYSATVDPTNSSVLYVPVNDVGVLKSSDGGASWSERNAGLSNIFFKNLVIDPHDPNTLYVGSGPGDGGVFKSSDGGVSWSKLDLAPNYVWTLVMDPTDPHTLYAGTSAGAGLWKTSDAGANWSLIGGATGLGVQSVLTVAVDPHDSQSLYAGTASGVFQSTDGGGHWLFSGLAGKHLQYLAFDPRDARTIYGGIQQQGIYKSTDGGANWNAINNGLTSLATSRGKFVIDPTAPDTLYLGTEGGGVFRSTDGGGSWWPLSTGLTNRVVFDLTLDPHDRNVLYAATNGGSIFRLDLSPAPTVESVVVNDGSAQRSMVTSLTVTFSTVVRLDPGAFELVRQGGGVIDVQITEAVAHGHSVDTLTFVGAGIIGGSLADGHYTLTIHGDRVHDRFGQVALDGAGTGVEGSDRTDNFSRLFGDSDGAGHVGLRDLLRFAGTLGKRAGDPGYLAYFDYDGDGGVDFGDLFQLLRRFGR